MSKTTYEISRAVLDTQVMLADKTEARTYFIPGNHDWATRPRRRMGRNPKRTELYKSLGQANVKFFPEEGCGGPVEVSVSENVTMVFFDSQWWIHQL